MKYIGINPNSHPPMSNNDMKNMQSNKACKRGIMVGTRLSDLIHFFNSQVLKTILVGLCLLILERQISKSATSLTCFFLWDVSQDRGPMTQSKEICIRQDKRTNWQGLCCSTKLNRKAIRYLPIKKIYLIFDALVLVTFMILKPGAKDNMIGNDPQQDKEGKILVKWRIRNPQSSSKWKTL